MFNDTLCFVPYHYDADVISVTVSLAVARQTCGATLATGICSVSAAVVRGKSPVVTSGRSVALQFVAPQTFC